MNNLKLNAFLNITCDLIKECDIVPKQPCNIEKICNKSKI